MPSFRGAEAETLKALLLKMPAVGDDADFTRPTAYGLMTAL